MTTFDLTPSQQGDLSRMRDIKAKIGAVLNLTGDPAALNSFNQGAIDTLQTKALEIYAVVENCLADLGYPGIHMFEIAPQHDRLRGAERERQP